MTTRTRSSFYPAALITLVIGLVLSASCAWLVARANEARVRLAVEDIVQDTTDAVFNRVQMYQYGLRGVRGAVLTAGDSNLTRELFRRYSESRDVAVEFPGARGFGFVRRVSAETELAFLAKARAEAGQGFSINSLGPHDGDKWVIQYIEPNRGNLSAIGFDIGSEPHRRKALQEAIDTGEVRLTQPITLMQAQSKPQQSFLMLMPVYRTPKTPETVEERRRQAVGLSYAPLLMSEVLQGLRIDSQLLNVRLSDLSGGEALPLTFFDNHGADLSPPALYPQRFERVMFGRQWCFEFSVTRAFVARQGVVPPVYLWLGGLALSLVLAGLAGAIAVSRAQRREITHARMELGAIVESASDAIIGKTLGGLISSWNRGAEQLFGYTAREAIGRPITQLIVPPERFDEEGLMLDKIAHGDQLTHFETVRLHKTGQRIQVAITPSPVRNVNGIVVGASVTARDITLQKAQTERIEVQNEALKEQVHESQATTQAILDTVIDPILSISESGTVLSFNPASTRVFGYEADEIIGQHVTRLIPQHHWPAYEQFVARTLERAAPSTRSQEIHGLRKDGNVFPTRVSVGMKYSGEARVFVCVVTDITTEIKQRNELLAARDHLLLAADAAELGIWSYSLADGSLSWNARMYELYGLKPSQPERLHYEDWLRCLYPDDVARCDAVMSGMLERNEEYSMTFRALLPDGQIRHIQAGGRIELDADGKPLRVTGINRDITLQQEIEATLRQAKFSADHASAAKSAFLANMSHEIRTPLNAVLGMLQLTQRTELDAQQRDYVAKARQAARSLLELLNDILDYSKIEAGKLKLDSHAFELDELLTELAVIIAGNQGGKDVEAVFDIDPTVPSLLVGDSLRLKQVLVNLVGNALKFTLTGEVVVKLEVIQRGEGSVVLRFSVSDSGIGISKDQRERIFQGFSQAETSTSRRFGGTGLGLVISNRLLMLMGSELHLDSEVDVGSRFWFDVPLHVQDGGEVPLPLPGRRLPLRLLVVDDNPTSADVLSRTVQALGWTVQLAFSGKEALERIRRVVGTAAPYDVVLMDWRMADLDGVATAKLIQEALPSGQAPHMIMVTAYADQLALLEPSPHKALFATTLSKPVTPRQLRDCVLGVVEGRPMTPPPALERPPKRLAGLHVLVVEDNAVNRQVASGLLHLEGANVTLAGNGFEAIAALDEAPNTYDAVLMDVQMPEMDGLEATQRIRLDGRFNSLPIIAMTANASVEDRQACLAAGMDDHISKPVELVGLVKCINDWVGQGRAQPPVMVTLAPEDGLLEAWSAVTGRFGGDLELLRNVLEIFAIDTRDLLKRLDDLAPTGDRAAARAIFHAIKGSAANIGAKALSVRAGKLESTLERDDALAVQAVATGEAAKELMALLIASEAQLQARLA